MYSLAVSPRERKSGSSSLELVLMSQGGMMVLYDKAKNSLITKYPQHQTDSEIESVFFDSTRIKSTCPLCLQTVDASRADLINERYFQLLESVHERARQVFERSSSENPFSASEATSEEGQSGYSDIVNAGYYNRFFVEKRCLGKGSYGSVYLCTHHIDDVELGDFAVKKISVGDNREWFRKIIREVKALERLTNHPNIVSYKHSWLDIHRHSEFCPYQPFLFILMTYCDKGSLEDFVKFQRQTGFIEETEIWSVLIDILSGLSHLHRQGVLHKDIKLQNILLITDETRNLCKFRAVIADFGTSEIVDELLAGRGHKSRGFTGTIEFTAPDVLINQEYTEYSEMWSVGIILFVLCFGFLPYTHDDPQICAEIIKKHQELEIPSSSQNDPDLINLILALTDKEEKKRPLCAALLQHPIIAHKIAQL
jgi:Protein kinase domain